MQIKFLNTSHDYKGLTKNDTVYAIKEVNLSIEDKGEFVAIVGKTGSGKTTLVEHMNGLILPTDGFVDILGYKIGKNKKKNPKLLNIRKKVGFVFQFPEYQLFEETVLNDIMFAPKNFGYKDKEAKAHAIEAANLVQLDPKLLNKSPFNLSGGQMRKVAIAGILAYNPDVLLLDEPTRGLDPKGMKDVMDLFYKINQKMNKTIVLISHSMDNVYEYASRVIVMNDGRVAYDGDKLTLFKSGKFKDLHLEKPQVLKVIDYLNEELGLNLDYDIYTLEQLEAKLKEVYHD